MPAISERLEWLEADGLGGFASGTTAGIRTRRYHALLLSAATPPTGRLVLVAGLDAHVRSAEVTAALSSHRYAPGVIHPDGTTRITGFTDTPWPRWTYRLASGAAIEHSIVVPKGWPVTVLRWRLLPGTGAAPTTLEVRPFLAGRDYHALHHENGAFNFDVTHDASAVRWQMYRDVPAVLAASNGSYSHHPDWYRRFEYTAERDRGLDSQEDLGSPGAFAWELSRDDAVLVLGADTGSVRELLNGGAPMDVAATLENAERHRRSTFANRLDRSADAYLVRRGEGSTIIAGYPWFTDWGRDTFIALRGLCLATGRFADARAILLAWSGEVSEGMLPNRFPDGGDRPEFNAVDASLWFVIAAHELMNADPSLGASDRASLQSAIERILDGYSSGTRFGIRADRDGLLAAGVPGVQLTWMDARVGDRVITPRIGKPVEVQALWINALWIAGHFCERWKEAFARAFESFETRFWNETGSALHDVVDVDHTPGRVSDEFRPNQILAIGGLPLALLSGERAKRLVQSVEDRLWTPIGLRSLAPDHPDYVGRYAGGVAWRDGAYHQGTVWPWLLGPFVEAWVRTHGDTTEARADARERFLEPLLASMEDAGLGHLTEVADGDSPHTPGGCPQQAWSLGEALRLDRTVLADAAVRAPDTSSGRTHPTTAARS